MQKFILAAALFFSGSAFASGAQTGDVCLLRAQQQAKSMLAISFEVEPSAVSIVDVDVRQITYGNSYRVQTVVNIGETSVPVEIKVKAFKNALGRCTTLALEVGEAG